MKREIFIRRAPRCIGKRMRGQVLPLVLLLAGLLLSAGCEKEQARFSASGTFEADEVDISSEAAGRLLSLAKREGEEVSRGELLAEVDSDKLRLERDLLRVQLEEVDLELTLLRRKLQASRIRLANNSRDLDRYRNLARERSAAQKNVDDIDTAVRLDSTSLRSVIAELERPDIKRRELETRISLAEERIEDTRTYSPIDGRVIDRYAEPGEVVAPGTPLLKLADLSLLELRVYLPAPMLGRVKLDQQLEVRADGAPDRRFSGRVVWVSPDAEFTPKNVQTPDARAELVYAVKLEVPNDEGILKIGMPADVYFE